MHIGLTCHIWGRGRLDKDGQGTSLLTLSHFVTFFEFPTLLLQLLKRELSYPQITGNHHPNIVSSRRESTGSHGFTEMCSNDTVQRKLPSPAFYTLLRSYRNHVTNSPTRVLLLFFLSQNKG